MIVVDSSTQAIKYASAVTSLASNTFSPPAGSLLVAVIAGTGNANAATSVTDNADGNNGIYTGTFTLGQTGIPGSAATATLFNSGDVTTNRQYSSPQGPFTLECWVKTTSVAGVGIMGFSNPQTGAPSSNFDRFLYIGTDGKLYFGIFINSGVTTINSAAAINDGTWHHVVGVLAANNNMSLYVDGSLVASNSNTNAPQNYNGWWRVGVGPNSGWPNQGATPDYMIGTLAHAAIYNVALSSGTISSHYAAGSTSGTSYDGTVAGTTGIQEYWKLGDSSGSTAVNTVDPPTGYTLLKAETANGCDAEIWARYSPGVAAATTVTVSFAAAQDITFGVIVLTGANATQALNATNGTTSASGTPSGTVTSTAVGSYTLSVVANATNQTAPVMSNGGATDVFNGQTYRTLAASTRSAWALTAGNAGNSGNTVTFAHIAPTAIAYSMVTVEILSAAQVWGGAESSTQPRGQATIPNPFHGFLYIRGTGDPARLVPSDDSFSVSDPGRTRIPGIH